MSKKDKKQNPTKPNKFTMMSYHQEAVVLRYQGKKYHEIATYLQEKYKRNIRHQKVRTWFMRDGVLEKEYIDYAQKENDRIRKHTTEEMKKLLPKIAKGYDEILNYASGSTDEKIVEIHRKTLKDLCTVLDINVKDTGVENPLTEYLKKLDEISKENETD